MQARAVEFTAPREVRVVDIELEEPNEDEILVRTTYSGISSGTELLAYRGQVDPDLVLDESVGALDGTFAFPFRYGYSCVGVVEGGSDRIPDGTIVFAFHPHQTRFMSTPGDVVVLPDIDPRVATLFPLVETALQITLDAGDVFESDVVVMGLGTVGLLTALLLRRAGARVLGVEPSPFRRELAEELDVIGTHPADARDAVAQATRGRGVAIAVESSGNPAALAEALPLLQHEGTALVASWYGTNPVTLPLGADFHRRRLGIRSTQVSTIPARLGSGWTLERRREHAVSLLQELPLKRLATHTVAFDDAPAAFALLDRGDDDVMHVALTYGDG